MVSQIDPHVFISSSLEETEHFGQEFAKRLKVLDVIAFLGDLGSGKTTLIKSIIACLTGISSHAVSSPTYTYLNIYNSSIPIYHFDLYRLNSSFDFLSMGFDEFFNKDGICFIEWAENVKEILPEGTITVSLEAMGLDQRKISVFG